MTRTIDQLLDQARAQLRRLHPHQAAASVGGGGLLVDIRPAAQRLEEGEVPGAVLQDLGLHRATDLIGGFRAWARAGLPTRVASTAQ